MPVIITNLVAGGGSPPVGEGIELEGFADYPGPRVGITVGGLDPASESVINVWRVADGERVAVRGARNREVLAGDYIVDYEVPLGRDVWYELELVSGALGPLVTQDGIRFDSDAGWLSDPAEPSTSFPVYSRGLPNGAPTLAEGGLKELTLGSSLTSIYPMESDRPVVISSGRQAPSGLFLPVLVEDPTQQDLMRNLIKQSVVVLFRPLPEWSPDLPGVCYLAVEKPKKTYLNRHRGGTLALWEIEGFIAAAPSARVLVPLVTYGDVEPTWLTYNQAQSAQDLKTYLDVQKDPFNSGSTSLMMFSEE